MDKVGQESEENLNDIILKNFLSLLLENYDLSERLEDKISAFVDNVNDFLYGKHFVYDSGNLELFVESNDSHKKLRLWELSSGEKQIISILGNMYLNIDDSKKIFLMIDEPEISLSIEWQEKLVPKIIHAPNFGYLFAVTHSPFIFEDADVFEKTLNLTSLVKPMGGNRLNHGR